MLLNLFSINGMICIANIASNCNLLNIVNVMSITNSITYTQVVELTIMNNAFILISVDTIMSIVIRSAATFKPYERQRCYYGLYAYC